MAIHRKVLIQSPTGGSMVDDDIPYRVATECVVTTSDIRLAAAKPHIAYDHVMSVDPEGFPGHTDTVARGGLTFDGDIRCTDDDRAMQMDDTRYIENDDARPTLLAGPAKRTGTRIVQ